MKGIVASVLFTVFTGSAWGGDLRIARCDIQRVFDQYQHTIDIRSEIDRRRNVTGPQTALNSWDMHLHVRQGEELAKELKQSEPNTPEREKLQRHGEWLRLEMQLDDLEIRLEMNRREQSLKDEVSRWRDDLLSEIKAGAKALAIERGYDMVVSDSLPSAGSLTALFVTKRADDVTDELLARLNKQYASTTNQGLHPKAEKKP